MIDRPGDNTYEVRSVFEAPPFRGPNQPPPPPRPPHHRRENPASLREGEPVYQRRRICAPDQAPEVPCTDEGTRLGHRGGDRAARGRTNIAKGIWSGTKSLDDYNHGPYGKKVYIEPDSGLFDRYRFYDLSKGHIEEQKNRLASTNPPQGQGLSQNSDSIACIIAFTRIGPTTIA